MSRWEKLRASATRMRKVEPVEQSRKLLNIALVGFMGTGKTSVGHVLASILRFRFIDTDDLIEARARRRIAAIFAEEGEERFREYERQVVEDLQRFRRTVLATGGGLAANAANMASLKTHSFVVCLWASPEAIFERVRHQSHRPLLHTPNPLARIRSLFADRARSYREADVLVNTERRNIREVALQAAHHFRLAHRPAPSREDRHSTKSA